MCGVFWSVLNVCVRCVCGVFRSVLSVWCVLECVKCVKCV